MHRGTFLLRLACDILRPNALSHSHSFPSKIGLSHFHCPSLPSSKCQHITYCLLNLHSTVRTSGLQESSCCKLGKGAISYMYKEQDVVIPKPNSYHSLFARTWPSHPCPSFFFSLDRPARLLTLPSPVLRSSSLFSVSAVFLAASPCAARAACLPLFLDPLFTSIGLTIASRIALDRRYSAVWSSSMDSGIDLASEDVILDFVIAGRWAALLMRRFVSEEKGAEVDVAAASVLRARIRVASFILKSVTIKKSG